MFIHPQSPHHLDDLLRRIAIGPLPAWLVLLMGVAFNMFLAVLIITTRDRTPDDEPPAHAVMRERQDNGPLADQ